MAIQVVWDDEQKTLIRVTFDGPYTWVEYDGATDEIVRMIQSVSYTVDALLLPDRNGSPTTRR